METTFAPLDVVATAQAIYREQGYIKKAYIQTSRPDVKPNSLALKEHYTGKQEVSVTPSDCKRAADIINYLSGLSFKAMERGLTQFETNILKFVTSEQITLKEVGISASLPQMFEQKLSQDKWEQRERELSNISEFVGELGKRSDLTVTVENIRFIGRTSSYLYCTSTPGGKIVKFFHDTKLGEVGTTLTVNGYVKSQEISKFHGGKETMINRIKIENN